MVYLVNQDGLEYHFKNLDIVDWNVSTNAYVMPIVEMNEGFVFNLGGRTFIMRIDWVIKDESDDVSNGTYSSVVKTKAEQIKYLEENFVTSEIDLKVTVKLDEIGLSYSGIPKRFSARWRAGEEVVDASIELIIGNVILG